MLGCGFPALGNGAVAGFGVVATGPLVRIVEQSGWHRIGSIAVTATSGSVAAGVDQLLILASASVVMARARSSVFASA